MHCLSRSGHWAVMRWLVANSGGKLRKFGELENTPFRCGPNLSGNIQIALLRDPYNWWASTIGLKAPEAPARPVWGRHASIEIRQQRIAMWRGMARVFTGKDQPPCEVELVKFNDWFSSEEYRQKLKERFDLVSTHEALSEVSDGGGGSTFDTHTFDGRAQEMKVLERYKLLLDDEIWREILEDEVIELAEEIFGMRCPIEISRR